MTKVQQKSEKISAFGGIFFVLDKFDRILSSVIDSHLGLRSKLIGYQYSEIMLTLTLQGTGTCSMYRRISELQHCSKCNGREQRKKKSLQAFCRLSFWISIFETYLSLIGGFLPPPTMFSNSSCDRALGSFFSSFCFIILTVLNC